MKVTGKIANQGLKAVSEKSPLQRGRRTPRIWVVVADKGIARIFRKPDVHIELIGELHPDETEQAALTNQTLGRVVGGSLHHTYEPHMAQSRQDELLFAQDVAKWLEKANGDDAFDRLVLAASPRMLGDLRAVMNKTVQGRIAAEVDKDLTGLDEITLRKALAQILWF